jgi:integrase
MLTDTTDNATALPKGVLCMKGQIYKNKGGYVVRFGRDLSKWYKSKAEAERFLTGIRYETDQGKFDRRDYAKDKPLAFCNLAEQYLEFKKKQIDTKELKPGSYENIKRDLTKAMETWGYSNIKSIGYAEIQDFLIDQKVSGKTRANIKSNLHSFFTWLKNRKIITLQQFPEFPQVKFELGWRNIVDIETQQKIISEVKRISYDINPKIWLGIKWLSTYISVRPGELISLKEKHINTTDGFLIIPHPKEKEPKLIYLLDDDAELLREMPRGLPDLHFFRHIKGHGHVKAGSPFGRHYFWLWWKRACKNLGIKGVDLYGGTRHSTATALGRELTPEQIKKGMLHKTNKAFERYFQSQQADAKMVYQKAQNLQHTYNQGEVIKLDKALKLKE